MEIHSLAIGRFLHRQIPPESDTKKITRCVFFYFFFLKFLNEYCQLCVRTRIRIRSPKLSASGLSIINVSKGSRQIRFVPLVEGLALGIAQLWDLCRGFYIDFFKFLD